MSVHHVRSNHTYWDKNGWPHWVLTIADLADGSGSVVVHVQIRGGVDRVWPKATPFAEFAREYSGGLGECRGGGTLEH